MTYHQFFDYLDDYEETVDTDPFIQYLHEKFPYRNWNNYYCRYKLDDSSLPTSVKMCLDREIKLFNN